MKKLLMVPLLFSATMSAYAVDSGAVVGGAVGGAAGAAIGHNLGGRDGAILGAAIGGATGAAIGSNSGAPAARQAPVQTVSREVKGDEDRQRHDNGLHSGERKNKHRNKHERHEED